MLHSHDLPFSHTHCTHCPHLPHLPHTTPLIPPPPLPTLHTYPSHLHTSSVPACLCMGLGKTSTGRKDFASRTHSPRWFACIYLPHLYAGAIHASIRVACWHTCLLLYGVAPPSGRHSATVTLHYTAPPAVAMPVLATLPCAAAAAAACLTASPTCCSPPVLAWRATPCHAYATLPAAMVAWTSVCLCMFAVWRLPHFIAEHCRSLPACVPTTTHRDDDRVLLRTALV